MLATLLRQREVEMESMMLSPATPRNLAKIHVAGNRSFTPSDILGIYILPLYQLHNSVFIGEKKHKLRYHIF